MTKGAKVFTAVGIVLIAAALCLAGYNLWSDANAQSSVQAVVDRLENEIPEPVDALPDYILDPNIAMPTKNIDGVDYIGILYIPALELELSVAADWSYTQLRTTPCRYSGSAYLGDLVICAHNYSSHFGEIKHLSAGDEVVFTDADGNVFCYKVAGVEELAPTAIEEMTAGDFELSLFTCTVGGAARVTVRCVLDD